MNENDDLQLTLDDIILLEADNFFTGEEFPNFDVLLSPEVSETPQNLTSTEPIATESSSATSATADQSRFPVYSENDIEELQSAAVNKNTSRSTQQWLTVFKNWCVARHLQRANIETMAPAELDNILTQFYAEVKRKDGEDYEPDSLRIMQSAIERYLKEKNYPVSIVRSREFRKSQQTLNAKAISLRQQGKGKRPNKSQPLASEEESALWTSGQLGDFNGRVLTNVNFKNLSEQLGFRGRQEHYDSYVEDFIVRSHADGSESVEFSENPTKTRSGGLRIPHRTSPQIMWSTDGGDKDPVRLFKLWLAKRPEGMKNNGPLYLGVVHRPKSTDVWYGKVRMGQNTIGKIMKSMASCLPTGKKITNHSMRKTLVAKLKKSGQPRHLIREVTGHARESSLDDYDEVDEEQRRRLSHIISGYEANRSSQNELSHGANAVSSDSSQWQVPPLPRIPLSETTRTNVNPIAPYAPTNPSYQQQVQFQAMSLSNQGFMPSDLPDLSSLPYRMAAFSQSSSSNPPLASHFTGCTFNFYGKQTEDAPAPVPAKKKRRAVILDSDDETDNS